MIQLNLLPDVKLEYIKAQRSRRLVFAIALVTSSVAIVLLVALLVIGGLQKKYLNDVSNDVTQESAQLKAKPDINKILTVQNQLGSLTALHASKPATNRIFEYLNQVTPTQVGISSFKIDFATHTIVMDGGTDSLSSVNKYVDTLKYTKFTTGTSNTATNAFSNVVLASFGLSNDTAQSNNKPASFSVTFGYDPLIFDIAKITKLQVPSITTTRAGLDKTTDLFQAAPVTQPTADTAPKRSN